MKVTTFKLTNDLDFYIKKVDLIICHCGINFKFYYMQIYII